MSEEISSEAPVDATAMAVASTQDAEPVVADTDGAGQPHTAPIDDAYDAAFDKINSGSTVRSAEKAATAALNGKTEKPAASTTSDDEHEAGEVAAGTTPATQTTTQPSLSKDDQEILRRHKLTDEDLPANPERRALFLKNLTERHNAGNQMYRELEAYKAGKPPAATPPAQPGQPSTPVQQSPAAAPTSAEEAEALKYINEFTSDDKFAGALNTLQSKAISAAVAPYQQKLAEHEQAASQANQLLQMQGAMLEQMHFDQGIEDAKKVLPATIVLDDSPAGKANLEKLMKEADPLLRANFNPRTFTLRHALAKAALLAFPTEVKLAERTRISNSQQRAQRGSPDRGQPSRSQPAKTVDQSYDEAYDKIMANA